MTLSSGKYHCCIADTVEELDEMVKEWVIDKGYKLQGTMFTMESKNKPRLVQIVVLEDEARE